MARGRLCQGNWPSRPERGSLGSRAAGQLELSSQLALHCSCRAHTIQVPIGHPGAQSRAARSVYELAASRPLARPRCSPATSAAAGQMMGWHSTLQWLDAKTPNTDLLVLRIDLVLKPPLGLYHRPSCLVFPFQGHMFNATDAFVYVPHSERASFMTELMVEVPLSEDEIGLHCLLGRYPNAAPLLLPCVAQ